MLISELPVAVIGAGPVGLAAAAHLLRRGLQPLIFERGTSAGATVAQWAHVRVFSPWEYNVDAEARVLLEENDWIAPVPDYMPTGAAATISLHSPHIRRSPRTCGLTPRFWRSPGKGIRSFRARAATRRPSSFSGGMLRESGAVRWQGRSSTPPARG